MSTLAERVGKGRATELRFLKLKEIKAERYGLRDPDEPSEADTQIRHEVMRSEFTAEERELIRIHLGIEPVVDLEL